MLKQVLTHVLNRVNWKQSYSNIGAIEKVSFDKFGKSEARVDTGNESCNALHATDIVEKDGKVSFKSFDGKKVTLPIEDGVRIRSNNHVSEKRIMVLLDFSIGKRIFKDVAFNLSDRSNNEYPVLIGHKFLVEHRFIVNPSKENILESKISKLFKK
jgi:hypothetical protein